MVWKSFNASPNTSPFFLSDKPQICNLSFKDTLLMRPFIIFQYSANISHHFQIHHASSPFTPAPRTVTSAAMALGTCIFQYRAPADAQGINFSSAMLQHVLIFPCSIGHLVFLRPSNMIFHVQSSWDASFSNKVGCVLCHIQKKAQRVAWEQTTTDGPTTYTNQPRHCPTMSSKHAGAGSVSR